MKIGEIAEAIANEGLLDEDIVLQYRGKDGKIHIINETVNFNKHFYDEQSESKALNRMYKSFENMSPYDSNVHLNENEMYILNFMRKNKNCFNGINRQYKPCTEVKGTLMNENDAYEKIISEYKNREFKY